MAQQHKPRHDITGGAIREGASPGTFRVGDTVPLDGDYSCRPCGEHRRGARVFNLHLNGGETFPPCPGCGELSVWEPAHSRRIP